MRLRNSVAFMVVLGLLLSPEVAVADPPPDETAQEEKTPEQAKLEEIEELNTMAFELLEEIGSMQREVLKLKNEVDQMDRQLVEAKEKLRNISIASKPARHLLKQIKTMEPELKNLSQNFKEKSADLGSKLISLGLIEEKLYWLEDELGGPLLQTVTRQLAPKEDN